MPGALCETEPQVLDFWLSCIGEMLDAGVDGIDIRISAHGSLTEAEMLVPLLVVP